VQRARFRDSCDVTQSGAAAGSGVFRANRRQADNDVKKKHETPRHTHINRVTVFCAVRPEAIQLKAVENASLVWSPEAEDSGSGSRRSWPLARRPMAEQYSLESAVRE
jgi:hypothetical protein